MQQLLQLIQFILHIICLLIVHNLVKMEEHAIQQQEFVSVPTVGLVLIVQHPFVLEIVLIKEPALHLINVNVLFYGLGRIVVHQLVMMWMTAMLLQMESALHQMNAIALVVGTVSIVQYHIVAL